MNIEYRNLEVKEFILKLNKKKMPFLYRLLMVDFSLFGHQIFKLNGILNALLLKTFPSVFREQICSGV